MEHRAITGSSGSAGPLRQRRNWARYDLPARDAIVRELQVLRAEGVVTAASVAEQYALMHLPFALAPLHREERAALVVEAVRQAAASELLSPEQQIIARWVLFPPASHAQRFLHERQQSASEEIESILTDPRTGAPLRRSVKQVQDRESRMLLIVAGLLLDERFAESLQPEFSGIPSVQPPDDPYQNAGYEWVESNHELRFDKKEPTMHELRYDITIRAVRHDQRLFWIRHDPRVVAHELPVTVLSGADGHSLFGRLEDPRPFQEDADLLYFSLGKTLSLGEVTTISFTRGFRAELPPSFAMEMDSNGQARLKLSVYLPRILNCRGWAREVWTDGSASGQPVLQERFSIPPNSDTHAEFEVFDLRPYHLYRIIWWHSGESGS